MSQERITRRFLIQAGGIAGGGFMLGFRIPDHAAAQATAPDFAPNAFIRVSADNSVTFVLGVTEIGQGVVTALPMLMAEEMEVDLDAVRVEFAAAEERYSHPGF